MNGETLVRDGIRAWQEETGDTRPVRKAPAEELPDLFRSKLQEELSEYLESGNFEELCDLIDVGLRLRDTRSSASRCQRLHPI